ncbi:SurA N-terminal domain-containing protein [Streptomyces sp. NPDC058442]|uniref:SurA N-terminal domain-containing protein n=1 Tax=Streptomyces sp. NPDC058442 TaxID=3346503 RepID=UPI003653C367
MHRRRRTALLLTAALTMAAPLLTACGNDAHPGAAAVVGGQRITVSQLEDRVGEIRAAQQEAVPEAQYEQAVARTGSLTRDTLHGMVLDRVLERAARDAGVSVTPKEVQQMRAGLEQQAGGAEALETAWLRQYGIPPQRLDGNLRLQVQAQKLAQQLGADTSRPEFWQALSEASRKLDVDLNPRYGTWDDEKSSRVDARTPWVRDVTVDGVQPIA